MTKKEIIEIFREFRERYQTADWIESEIDAFHEKLMAPVLKIVAEMERKSDE